MARKAKIYLGLTALAFSGLGVLCHIASRPKRSEHYMNPAKNKDGADAGRPDEHVRRENKNKLTLAEASIGLWVNVFCDNDNAVDEAVFELWAADVHPDEALPLRVVKTNQNGVVVIPSLQEGYYVWQVSAQGFQPERGRIGISEEKRHDLRVDLERCRTIDGVVIQSDGVPLNMVFLKLWHLGKGEGRYERSFAVTDSNGEFSFNSLMDGEYFIEAEAVGALGFPELSDGVFPYRAENRVWGPFEAPARAIQLVVEPEGLSIVGKVLDKSSGEPIDGATVRVSCRWSRGGNMTPIQQFVLVPTNNRGEYYVDALDKVWNEEPNIEESPDGLQETKYDIDIAIDVSASGYQAKSHTLRSAREESGVPIRHNVFLERAAQLSIELYDGKGEALQISLSGTRMVDKEGKLEPSWDAQVFVDTEVDEGVGHQSIGRGFPALLAVAPYSRCKVWGVVGWCKTDIQEVWAPGPGETEAVALSLKDGFFIEGCISWEATESIKGVRVYLSLYSAKTRQGGFAARMLCSTEESGQFAFVGLRPGRYFIGVLGRGNEEEEIVISNESVYGFKLTLPRAD